MKDDFYPQEISADEAALGFQRLLIDGIGDLRASMIYVVPVPVVAKILDSSDVLIKIYDSNRKVAFSHKRWGRDRRIDTLDVRRWFPIHAPIGDARLVIDNYKTGRMKGMFEDEIIGFPFKYREAPAS